MWKKKRRKIIRGLQFRGECLKERREKLKLSSHHIFYNLTLLGNSFSVLGNNKVSMSDCHFKGVFRDKLSCKKYLMFLCMIKKY